MCVPKRRIHLTVGDEKKLICIVDVPFMKSSSGSSSTGSGTKKLKGKGKKQGSRPCSEQLYCLRNEFYVGEYNANMKRFRFNRKYPLVRLAFEDSSDQVVVQKFNKLYNIFNDIVLSIVQSNDLWKYKDIPEELQPECEEKYGEDTYDLTIDRLLKCMLNKNSETMKIVDKIQGIVDGIRETTMEENEENNS